VDKTNFTFPQATLRERLVKLINDGMVRRGRNVRDFSHELRIVDIADYTGVRRPILSKVAHGKLDMSAEVQIRLTQFFQLWDSGRLKKIKIEKKWSIERSSENPDLQIDNDGSKKLFVEVGPHGPRFKRLPPV
jgi:predicted transcriptional regulator